MEEFNLFEKINWLASYPKSGNTWIRCLLYAYNFGSLNINQMQGFTSSDIAPGPWFATTPLPWALMNEDLKIAIRNTVLLNVITHRLTPKPLVKTHCGNFRVNSVDLIPAELTESAVCIIRDPRDIVISYSKHFGQSIEETIIDMKDPKLSLDAKNSGILHVLGTWSDHVSSWHANTKFRKLIVRYEDLLVDTEDILREIIKMLAPDVEINEDRLKLAVELTKFDKLKKQEETSGFKEASDHTKFFTVGKSGGWEETLTKDQISKIEEDHHEVMEKVGYKLYT